MLDCLSMVSLIKTNEKAGQYALLCFPLKKANIRLTGSKAQKRSDRTLNNTDRHFHSKEQSVSTFKESFQKYISIQTPVLSFTVKEHSSAEINDKYNKERRKLAICIGFSEHEQKEAN